MNTYQQRLRPLRFLPIHKPHLSSGPCNRRRFVSARLKVLADCFFRPRPGQLEQTVIPP